MTAPQSGPSVVLSGPTAAARMWAPYKIVLPLLYPTVTLFALSGRLHYGRFWTITSFIPLLILCVYWIWAARKGETAKQAEIALGYTTAGMPAYKDPSLWFLHPKTKEVVSGPFEPRPENTRKATMDAWMRERRSRAREVVMLLLSSEG